MRGKAVEWRALKSKFSTARDKAVESRLLRSGERNYHHFLKPAGGDMSKVGSFDLFLTLVAFAFVAAATIGMVR